MADQILKFSSRSSQFRLPAQTVAATDVNRVSTSSNDELLVKIDTLTHQLEVSELERRFSRFGRRCRSTSCTRSSRESNASGYYWYHAEFGDRGHKCKNLALSVRETNHGGTDHVTCLRRMLTKSCIFCKRSCV